MSIAPSTWTWWFLRHFAVLTLLYRSAMYSTVLLQDLCLIQFDMENLTPTFPTETEPRRMTCKLLKLLASGHVPQPNGVDDDEESDHQEEEAEQNEGDAAQMEAENMIPPIANDQGDGVLGELEIAVQKGEDFCMPEIEEAVEQPGVHDVHVTPPDPDDEMFINEEELCYEPTSSAHHPLPEEDPVYSLLLRVFDDWIEYDAMGRESYAATFSWSEDSA